VIYITALRKELAIPAICGMASPIVMIGLWTLASILRPGYDQLTQSGSELGSGRYSVVMNVNFAATGALVLTFWVGLMRNMHAGKWSRFGLVIFATAAATQVATGIFPCDPGCPLNDGSLSQMIHTGIAVVFFCAMAVFPVFIGIGLNRDQYWTSYRSYSLVTGVASIGLFIAFSVAVLTSFHYVGLLQRFFLAAPFQWIGITANRLRDFTK
jgi:hypothetical protein